MPNLNRCMLIGNLTRDPELRHLPSGTAVASFTIATNRTWKNQEGEKQEEVAFIDCECFGRRGEAINQYLSKGKPLFVEGRLKLDQWQNQAGENRSKLKVVVENFEFLGDGGESGGGRQQSAPPKSQSPPDGGGGDAPPGDDDIPF